MSLNSHFNNSTQNKNKLKFIKDNFNYDITETKNYNYENETKKDFKLSMLLLSIKIIYGTDKEALNIYYISKIIFESKKIKNFHIEGKNKRSNIHIMDVYNYLMYKNKRLLYLDKININECIICYETKQIKNIKCSNLKCEPTICGECVGKLTLLKCPISRGDLRIEKENLIYRSRYNNKIIEYQEEIHIIDNEYVIYNFVKDDIIKYNIFLKTDDEIKIYYIEEMEENIYNYNLNFLQSNINKNFEGLEDIIPHLQEEENLKELQILMGIAPSYNVSTHEAKQNLENLYNHVLDIDGLECVLNTPYYYNVGSTFGNHELQNVYIISDDDIREIIDIETDREEEELFFYE